jgi:transposase-like protein
MEHIKTLLEAVTYFSDFNHCKEYMVALRWPKSAVTCPRCGGDKVIWMENQRAWKCYAKHPSPKFTLKTGTIFEDSPIALEKWLPCVWLIVNAKNGISSWEIHRALGVTQKTAWFMLHRVRLAMQDDLNGGSLSGEVEVDETFIGGKARNMHRSTAMRNHVHQGGVGKTVVLGALERGGKVCAAVATDRKKKTMQPFVQAAVEPGATVHSDEFAHVWRMDNDYVHKVVNHLEAYVNGNVHTNGMENFWSLLKRGLGGTYVSVEPFHLFRYVDEQVYRFNNRNMSDGLRFRFVMRHIVGRRLTYKELTGKEAETGSHEGVRGEEGKA